MPKRLCVSAVTLAASLTFITSGARAESATHSPLAPVSSEAGSTERQMNRKPPEPYSSELENTGRNVRDSGTDTLTAQDQGTSSSDRKVTAAIRRAVVKNKSLSLDAHNIKIITRDGVVTLRGPVENSAEKIKLQSIAKKIRGVKQVDNQLEIKTP